MAGFKVRIRGSHRARVWARVTTRVGARVTTRATARIRAKIPKMQVRIRVHTKGLGGGSA